MRKEDTKKGVRQRQCARNLTTIENFIEPLWPITQPIYELTKDYWEKYHFSLLIFAVVLLGIQLFTYA